MSLYSYNDDPKVAAKRDNVSIQWVYRNTSPRPKPEFDPDGYPTESTCAIIKSWPISSNYSIKQLLAYVEEAWTYSFVIKSGGAGKQRWLQIATHGWSGNEELVGALRENRMFWALCWLQSSRGGAHRFLKAPIT